MKQLFVHVAQAIQGARSYQEDATAVWIPPERNQGAHSADVGSSDASDSREPLHLLAVLADGMGGHAGGAIASEVACGSFINAVRRHVDDESTPSRLGAGLNAANDAVQHEIDANPALNGMGCTLIGVAFSDEGAHWISVGDSPLYLYRSAEMVMLNEDHSMAPVLDEMARRGEITVEQARADRQRHFLRAAVSGSEIDLIDQSVLPLPLAADDYIVLASDGLQSLHDDEICECIAINAHAGADAVATGLLQAVEAAAHQHQDNASVVVVRVLADAGEPFVGGLADLPPTGSGSVG